MGAMSRLAARCAPFFLAAAVISAPAGSATADPVSVLYVNGYASTCSDSGPGSQAIPFCSIQAAADIVDPGQTVEITGGPQYAAVTISRSGTSAQPITFTSATTSGLTAEIYPANAVPALTIAGASHIVVSGLAIQHFGAQDGIDVTGSHAITLDRLYLNEGGSTVSAPSGIGIDGASSQVTVSRSRIQGLAGYAVSAAPGAQQITVTTNRIYQWSLNSSLNPAGGIVADGVSGLAIASNSVQVTCGSAIGIAGSSSGAVENNLAGTIPAASCAAPSAGLSVGLAAASAIQIDYNALFAVSPGAEYSWAGTAYLTAAAFSAATSQGAHDLDASATTRLAVPAGSPLIDSADCGAPGELATDIAGRSHVQDPLVPHTGAGSCYADRGAFEAQDPIAATFSISGALQGIAPLALTPTVTSGGTSPWGEPVSYAVNFGDGSAAVPVAAGGSVPYTYSTPGLYTLTLTASDSGGSASTVTDRIVVGTVSPPTEGLTARPWTSTTSLGQVLAPDYGSFGFAAGPESWEIAHMALAFGDGTVGNFGVGQETWQHAYPAPGTYTATLTVTDLFGRQTTAHATLTVGNEFQPQPPLAVSGTAPNGDVVVPAHRTIRLTMSRLNAGYSDIAAVQLVTTVFSPRAGGSLTIYPDGAKGGTPPSLNFASGQSVSNLVLAAPGSDGDVALYNSSGKAVDVALTTVGLEVTSNATSGTDGDTYVPLGPQRLLDTRVLVNRVHHPVAGGHARTFSVATAGVPASADGVLLDVTATNTRGAGSAVLYSAAGAQPGQGAPSPDWSAGQTVTNLVMVPVKAAEVTLRNASKRSADFMVDVVGYYETLGTAAVYLPVQAQLTGVHTAVVHAGRTMTLRVRGCLGAPASAVVALAVNLTVHGSAAGGYLTAYQAGRSRTSTRILSFARGQTEAGAAVLPVGSNGAVQVHNSGPRAVDVAVTLNGCYYQYPAGS
jgi:PKD repeat protein